MNFIVHNWPLILVALVSGGLLIAPRLRGESGINVLDSNQVVQLINKRHAQIIDIRPEEQFKTFALLQSKNIDSNQLKTTAPGFLKKDRPAIVVCEKGQLSAKGAKLLHKYGVKDTYVLGGGIQAWKDQGMPLRGQV